MIPIQNEEGELSDKSDEVGCLDKSEESGQKKYLEFKASKDMKKPKLVEGMVFPNVNVFRSFLKEFHIKEGCEYTYMKNEPTRVTVKCKDSGCGFRLHASPMHIDKSFQIKTLSGDHSCTRKYTNKYATHHWIANKYLEGLSYELDKKVKTLKNDVKREWMLDISIKKAYRAKRAAVERIQGNFEEQYSRIRDYCHVLLKLNPGSTALLKVERIGEIVHFQRMFVSFDAQVKGFLAGCRPFIGLDACFLKGPYGGQLMHATARDGNNQMYPLCMAIVESELKDSWAWFFDILLQTIGRPEQRAWCFMSDRQEGLIEAFKEVCPNVEHRFCLRHMYANFNKTFKGKELKDLFWGAASAYTEPEFKEKMAKLKGMSVDAHDWMMNEAPKLWARAYYSPRSKCNRMDNNISEGFNTWIKDARDKPILTLVETIRRQLMSRYVQRREFSTKFKTKLCPNIAKGIEKKKVNARGLQVIYAGDNLFEVTKMDKTFVVDIGQHTCSCRKWDLSGVPCVHGCAAIIAHKSQPEEFVDDWYKAETFVRTYNHRISPIPDKSLWPHTESDPLLPPLHRVPIGRPRKARRKGEDEPKNPYKVRKNSVTIMCRKCGLFGHNRRTCKTAPENFVHHKTKYFGQQKATYGGVPPAGKPSSKGSGSATTNEEGGRGRGRARGRGRGGGRGRGRGRGGQPSVQPNEQPQQQEANKRIKRNTGGWLSTQQSTTSSSPSKFAVGPMTRGGRIVTTISSQLSNIPNK